MRDAALAFIVSLWALGCYNPLDPFDPKYPLDLACDGTACPPGQTCGTDFVCHRSIPCGAGGACPTGLACDTYGPDGNVCRPACTNGSCPRGNACYSPNNACRPDSNHQPAFTGGPCASGCQKGTTCAPDQTCQIPCNNTCNVCFPNGTCATPTTPAPLECYRGFCVQMCMNGMSCPSGFFCGPDGNCAPTPDMAIAPTQQQFGQLAVGAEGQAVKFTVTNAGPGSMSFEAGVFPMIGSYGVPAPDWTIASDMCSALPSPLTAGSTCEIEVRFSPKSAGPKTAVLVLLGVTVIAGKTVATLSGEATSM
jgi:hypothetical protein